MSTASDPTPNPPTAVQASETTAQLVLSMQSFVEAFVRWSRSKADESGPGLSRLRLLNTLYCEGPQKMVDLADALGVTPRSVTALVDRLESDGVVKRVPHGTDRRVTMIELTQNAPDAAELFAAYQAEVAALCSTLSPPEQAEYLRLTRLLEGRLRQPAQ